MVDIVLLGDQVFRGLILPLGVRAIMVTFLSARDDCKVLTICTNEQTQH
jgi:hypothetical protein